MSSERRYQSSSRPRKGGIIALKLDADDELLVTSQNGNVIRIPVHTIRMQGRNTQGVRIMRLDKGDRAVAVARIGKLREGDAAGDEGGLDADGAEGESALSGGELLT